MSVMRYKQKKSNYEEEPQKGQMAHLVVRN